MGLSDKTTLAVLAELARTIEERSREDADASYTASLLNNGIDSCAKKFGEEAVELILASASKNTAHTTAEAADVLYHFLVLLQASGVSVDDVMEELSRRQGTSGHVEKAARKKD